VGAPNNYAMRRLHARSLLTRRREKKDGDYLKTLSELGHFLKGSSATLGLTKVKDSCEKIQHYGAACTREVC